MLKYRSDTTVGGAKHSFHDASPRALSLSQTWASAVCTNDSLSLRWWEKARSPGKLERAHEQTIAKHKINKNATKVNLLESTTTTTKIAKIGSTFFQPADLLFAHSLARKITCEKNSGMLRGRSKSPRTITITNHSQLQFRTSNGRD